METIDFRIIDAIYKIKNGKAQIHLYGRTPTGKQICVADPHFTPYFYVRYDPNRAAEIKTRLLTLTSEKGKIVNVEEATKELQGKPVPVFRVFSSIPGAVPDLSLAAKSIPGVTERYEYDILFVKRYFIDKRLRPFGLVQAQGEWVEEKSKVPVLIADRITPLSDQLSPDPRILSLDIETYNPQGKQVLPQKNPIVMIALYAPDFKKVFTWKQFPHNLPYVEALESEKEMLQRFVQAVEEYHPDIIAGYFTDGFDFPYLDTRAKKHKITLPLGLDYSELQIDKRGNTEASITGIAHFDVFRFVSRVIGRSLKTDSLKLDDVAFELLGERKHPIDMERLAHVWDNEPEGIAEYCKYNLQDTKLTYDLARLLLPNLQELVAFVGLPLFFVNRMSFSQLVEAFIMYQTPDFNALIPNKPADRESAQRRAQRFEGAFVFEPKPGSYKDIVVFDFRSLYPSIITAHNIDASTINCACCADKVPGLEYHFCRKKKGFLPTILENIINARSAVKKKLKAAPTDSLLAARSNMLKLLANSFYGYYGFFGARWYSFESGQSVTAYGRHYIKDVISKAGLAGFHVIYSDTDSIFITLQEKSKEDALRFVKEINDHLPGLMELEYEAFYPAGIFVSVKANEGGAKKKYALLNEQGGLKIRGFETVRRNVSLIAKEVQKRVLEIILKENNPQKAYDYVRDVVEDLRKKRIPTSQVVIRTQITKEMSQYDSVGPHVAAAQRLRDRGDEVGGGSIVEYVITSGSGRLRDRARLPDEVKNNEYDGEYYVTNQVVPSVERIFAVLGFDVAGLLALKAQSRLGQFFG